MSSQIPFPMSWSKGQRELAQAKSRTLFALAINSMPNRSGVRRYKYLRSGAVPHDVAEEMIKAVDRIYDKWFKTKELAIKSKAKAKPKAKAPASIAKERGQPEGAKSGRKTR